MTLPDPDRKVKVEIGPDGEVIGPDPPGPLVMPPARVSEVLDEVRRRMSGRACRRASWYVGKASSAWAAGARLTATPPPSGGPPETVDEVRREKAGMVGVDESVVGWEVWVSPPPNEVLSWLKAVSRDCRMAASAWTWRLRCAGRRSTDREQLVPARDHLAGCLAW